MQFSYPDYIVIALYVVIILYVGFFKSKIIEKSSDSKTDFILAGRKLTLPLFVATLVATWYGNIIGVGEFVFQYGLVTWICWGLAYYIAGGIFALFIAGKIRDADFHTIPEFIVSKYGKKAGLVAAVIVLIITTPAAYLFMLGTLLQMFLDIDISIAIIFGALISLVYLFTGGFKADVLTNAVQFVFMFLGFIFLLIFSINEFGGFDTMLARLPEKHLTIDGGLSWQYILAWYIIAFQTLIDPTFHQRCAAASSHSVAKKGVLISIGMWAIFDMLTLFTGFYSKAFIDTIPSFAYTELADVVLPVIFKGFFFITLLATVMSTLDSYAFISAATLGNDILKPYFEPFRDLSSPSVTRISLFVVSIAGVVPAILFPSAIDLIYIAGSIAVPGLLAPLIVAYSERIHLNPSNSVRTMIFSSVTSALWVFFSKMEENRIFSSGTFSLIEPMLPGIAVSIVMLLFFAKKK